MPLGDSHAEENMNTWFARHSIGAISNEEHERLFDDDRVAIHYPARENEETESLNPAKYDSKAARVIKRFAKLAEEGGYVWSQYSPIRKVKIGIVKPGSRVQAWHTTWNNPKYEKEWGDHPAILKTLRLTSVREIKTGELMSLRVASPRGGTLSKWPKVKQRLQHIISGTPLELSWKNLSVGQLETAVSEFLRAPTDERLPRLRFLLLPPGRTMKDVDVYGIAHDGRKIFAQVTYDAPRDPGRKLRHLAQYAEDGAHALFFCDVPDIDRRGSITLVPNDLVEEWLRTQRPFSEEFLDA
jgi:hypothetical protein